MSARCRKHDNTGRSSGIVGGRLGEWMRPPEGEPWVWLTRELMTSEAWRTMSKPTRKFIDFLMVENMNHAGTENGNLKATRTQLAEFGLSEHSISGAIEGAEERKLVKVRRHGMRIASTYTLTWLATRDGNPPSNSWKRYKKQISAPKNALKLPPEMHSGQPYSAP